MHAVKTSTTILAFLFLFVLISLSWVTIMQIPSSSASNGSNSKPSTTDSTNSTFAFVSNFETLTLEGWRTINGSDASVITTVNYSGEPSLASSNPAKCPCVQEDYANKGFVTGLSAVSFQVAINSQSSSGAFFGLGTSDHQFVAVVGILDDYVVAGTNLSSITEVETIPQGAAQPAGWVYLVANVVEGKHSTWSMQVFVDESLSSAATISVPFAETYSGVVIETLGEGSGYYSDIVVSSTQLATLLPRWNPMEGYGQGGACLCKSLNVKLLPLFSNLSANMVLSSWSVPEANKLSFQINSLNYTGTVTPKSCVGFFQLGLDLNQNNYIAPWYVIGNNCVAHYFDGKAGVYSPPNSALLLSILFEKASHQIIFTILDTTISQKFTATIPYYGSAFDSMFTQLEFQPSGNISLIQEYQLAGQMYNIQIVKLGGQTEALPASYMLPWSVDAPLSWNFGYYENLYSGYAQISN
jgi:hypothetical protein